MGNIGSRDHAVYHLINPTSQVIPELANQLPPRRQVDQGHTDTVTAPPPKEGSVMLLDS